MFNLREINDEKLKEFEKYMLICGEEFRNILISHYDIPEWFLHKYRDRWDWDDVCHYQNLSSKFLEDHVNEINACCSWYIVSRHQKLDIEFVRKNESDISWDSFLFNPHITKEIISEFYAKFSTSTLLTLNLIDNIFTDDELEALEMMKQITK